MRNSLFILILWLVSTSAAIGHEFWIAPQNYQREAGETIVADLRVGQKFAGATYAYIPNNFERFELVNGDDAVPVEGRIGDRPALNMAASGDGLWIVVHETTDSMLTWSEWEKFTGFVEHKDFPGVLEIHAERGYPETGFRESYRRFAKALVAVGSGDGTDRAVGLRTEIIALKNPYTADITDGLPVQVLLDGAARRDAQVEVFERSPAGEVDIFTTRTDATGQAIIPVKQGHEYLIDAVTMINLPQDDAALGPVWRSLWAALTFRVPG